MHFRCGRKHSPRVLARRRDDNYGKSATVRQQRVRNLCVKSHRTAASIRCEEGKSLGARVHRGRTERRVLFHFSICTEFYLDILLSFIASHDDFGWPFIRANRTAVNGQNAFPIILCL